MWFCYCKFLYRVTIIVYVCFILNCALAVSCPTCMCVFSFCLKRPLLKIHNYGFQDQLSLNAGQSIAECSLEHSAILSTFIELPFVIKTFALSILSGHFTQVLLYLHLLLFCKYVVCYFRISLS